MERKANLKRRGVRQECRKILARHINNLGFDLPPSKVRLRPVNEGYIWQRGEEQEFLFSKNLSKTSTGVLLTLCQEVGKTVHAVRQELLETGDIPTQTTTPNNFQQLYLSRPTKDSVQILEAEINRLRMELEMRDRQLGIYETIHSDFEQSTFYDQSTGDRPLNNHLLDFYPNRDHRGNSSGCRAAFEEDWRRWIGSEGSSDEK